ncbi:MAG: translational GTPase TypA, partial [Clostridia bacterium]|nr:translational GTPase TypA [Clostridia bacterium]
DEVLELLLELDATEEQLYSPIIYCSARQGTASVSPNEEGENMTPLFETILGHIPAPEGDDEGELQLLVSSIDYNEYVGRIGVGRIERGSIKQNQEVMVCDWHDESKKYRGKIANLYQIEGLVREPATEAKVGDVVCFSGLNEITIGETLCTANAVEPLPFVKISEPTVEMTFNVNDSPFAGREGKFVTSRQLRDRLYRELLKDVSLRVADTESTDSFKVSGRGEMHLSILIENMRREGYEFSVGAPKVLMKEIDGVMCEPMERLLVDVPENCVGAVMEKMGTRKGELVTMAPMGTRMRLEFSIPSRGLFGYKNEFLTDTKGEGILNSVFSGYKPEKGEISGRTTGSLVAFETGEAVAYGIFNAQERGTMFVEPGMDVYEGMVVGVSPKAEDINVNVCKKKHVTNMRAAGSDEALRLIPPKKMSLEEAIEFIGADELIEVTPESIRVRKRILDNNLRAKARNRG